MIGANFRYQVLQIAGRIVKYAQLSRLADGFGYGYVSGATADGSLGQQESQQLRFSSSCSRLRAHGFDRATPCRSQIPERS